MECQMHAIAFCDLLYHCWTPDQCQCKYLMVSRMLVVASSIYIHIPLFSEDGEQVQMV